MLSIRDRADRELENRVGITRKQKRYIKREVRAQQYAAVARQGGGITECARRAARIDFKDRLPWRTA